ncbi:MAG: HlyU family transcriptional regulator [Pseudomonadota bacterium]
MSFLKKLFGASGAGDATEAESETYKGFTITPTPQREGNDYRIAARIEKEVGGEVRAHNLIRADTIGALEAAQDASINKAKQMIDEQGDALFR